MTIESATLIGWAASLVGMWITYRLGIAHRTRGDLFALTGELRGLLLHERDACSPNCSGIGKTDRDRLPRLLQPWSRPRRVRRALRRPVTAHE